MISPSWTVRCPKCGARKGEPCVYVTPKANPKYEHTQKYQALLIRAGTPTMVPHVERRDLEFKKRIKALQKDRAEKAATDPRTPPLTTAEFWWLGTYGTGSPPTRTSSTSSSCICRMVPLCWPSQNDNKGRQALGVTPIRDYGRTVDEEP